MHLTLDGYGAAAPTIERLYQFLDEAPEHLAMTLIQPPLIKRHGTTLAGYVLLAESHISYHGYDHDEAHIVHLDAFSCNRFDPTAFARLAEHWFRITVLRATLDPNRLDLAAIGVPV